MLKHLKIKNLNISVMLMLLFLISIVSVLSYYFISTHSSNQTQIGSANYNSIIQAKDLTADILPPPEYIIESYMYVLQYLSEADATERDTLEKNIAALSDTYEDRHQYWDKNLKNEEMRQLLLVDSYQNATKFYDVFFNEIVPAEKNNDQDALISARIKLQVLFDNHRKAIDEAVTVSDKMATAVESSADKALTEGRILLIIVMAAILIIGTGLFALISYSITNPLSYISAKITEVSKGNLSFEIDESYISKSEMGQIMAAVKQMLLMLKGYIFEIDKVLNSMATGNMRVEINLDYHGDFSKIKESLTCISQTLRNAFGRISDAAFEINGTAEQISNVSQSLSQGSSEQSGTIDNLLTTMEEISMTSNSNCQYVSLARSFVEESNQDFLNCYENMHKLLESIGEINSSSKEISKIIKVIEEIAFQTNILALNASVEAARAGSSGKGFAVVADEVRSLASKCADAAHQTTELVNKSLKSVDTGTVMANNTEVSLNSVREKMATINQHIKNIESASDEQLPAILKVTTGFEQISQVVQINSATAEESAASSEQLYANSSVLKDLVAQFVL